MGASVVGASVVGAIPQPYNDPPYNHPLCGMSNDLFLRKNNGPFRLHVAKTYLHDVISSIYNGKLTVHRDDSLLVVDRKIA